ncbi:hypothetical protein V6N13_011167 [Hibiscus sabdariffa]
MWPRISVSVSISASAPSFFSSTNCDLVWCGDGECVSNGTGHICQCRQGSENLFNSSALPCFKPCYFGADCQALDLPFGNPPQQPPPPPPPASSNSPGSYDNGCAKLLGNSLRTDGDNGSSSLPNLVLVL